MADDKDNKPTQAEQAEANKPEKAEVTAESVAEHLAQITATVVNLARSKKEDKGATFDYSKRDKKT